MRALRDFLLAPPGGAAAAEPAPGAASGTLGPRLPWVRGATAGSVEADGFAGVGAGVVPGAVAVLCAAEDARAVAVATAALLARRARAPCSLACVWTAPDPHRHSEARPPAGRGARRLATALSARGVDALACGRSAVVALPADPDDALRTLARATAAAGAAPVVLVLGGPRAAAFDDVLAGQDRLLVVTRPGAEATIGALALAGLPAGGPSHAACVLALGPFARALAAAGLATPAALRRALDAGDREEGR